MRLDLNVTVTVKPIVIVLRNDVALQEEADALAADLKTSTDTLKAAEAAAAAPGTNPNP